MRIKKLHLQNFRGFENLEMTFPETSNLVVLIGKNGSGKSSVLDAVAFYLEQIATVLMTDKDIDFLKFMIPATGNLKKGKTWLDPFIIDMQFTYFKTIIPKDVSIIRDVLLDKKNENVLKFLEFIEYYRNCSTIISANTILNNLPILIYYSLNQKESNSDDMIKGILRNFIPYSLCYENAFCANVNNYDDFLEWYKENEDFENRERLEKDNNFRVKGLETVRKGLECFTTAISNLDVSNLRIRQYKKEGINVNFEKNTTNYYLSLLKDNIEFNFSELSSGERAIILLVADIARRLSIANKSDALNGNGIVLIDEIDQHLHPEWQRNILPALAKTFPNVQFIVTTHSPQVLANLPKENATIFGIENGKVYTAESQIGRDINWVLQTVMNDYDINIMAKTEFEAFFNQISNTDFTDETQKASLLSERIALSNKYGTDNTLLLKADMLIARKSKQTQKQ